jgi:hypothetical protein
MAETPAPGRFVMAGTGAGAPGKVSDCGDARHVEADPTFRAIANR